VEKETVGRVRLMESPVVAWTMVTTAIMPGQTVAASKTTEIDVTQTKMDREVVLGVLKSGGREHEVFAWKNYGIVCPGLVTTNGNAKAMADFIEGVLHHGDYKWEPKYKPDTALSLRDQLLNEYHKAFPQPV
jgi:hypothetical protein